MLWKESILYEKFWRVNKNKKLHNIPISIKIKDKNRPLDQTNECWSKCGFRLFRRSDQVSFVVVNRISRFFLCWMLLITVLNSRNRLDPEGLGACFEKNWFLYLFLWSLKVFRIYQAIFLKKWRERSNVTRGKRFSSV